MCMSSLLYISKFLRYVNVEDFTVRLNKHFMKTTELFMMAVRQHNRLFTQRLIISKQRVHLCEYTKNVLIFKALVLDGARADHRSGGVYRY